MQKKHIHSLIAFLFLGLTGFSWAGVSLSSAQKQTLNQIANEFNKTTSIKANFIQTSSRGGYAEGRMLMQRPGKMRMQYDKPVDDAALIVNSGVTLWWENGGKRNIPTGKTPISVLIKKNFSFFDENIDIIDYTEDSSSVTVTMQWKPRPQDGILSITMTKKKPVLIKGWSVTDAKGNMINIKLSNTKFGVTVPNKYFHVNTPVQWPK